MKFEERSYSTQVYIPRPECQWLEQEKLLAVATPWGSREIARESMKSLSEFVSSHYRDPEATSPYPKIPGMNDISNTIRIGALLVNERLYKLENKTFYNCGLELFAGMRKESELSWIHVGQPHVILLRRQHSPFCIWGKLNLSMNFEGTTPLDPLPDDFLGVSAIPPLFINSMRIRPDDKFILLNSAWIPSQIYSISENHWNLEDIAEVLIKSNSSQPFWLGLWEM